MESSSYEVLPVESHEVQILQADAVERANVDSQVATAKRYPRDIRRSIDNSVVMATMNQDTARSCSYALPRGGKPITGPSVHLAKIIVSNWGNIRTEAKVIQITDKQIISRGTCWDLETNVASAFEIRRSIVDSKGKRYSDDMITVTVYQAAQKFITGDLSDADKILKTRTNIINKFKNEYAITEEEVIKLCGKQTSNQIGPDEIAMLIGIIQALKDGDTTVNDLILPIRETKKDVDQKKETMRQSKGKNKEDMP